MSGEDMVRALGFIDEKYIAEAESTKLSAKRVWLKVGSVAACLCLLLTGIYSLRQEGIPTEGANDMAQVPAGGYESIQEDGTVRGYGEKEIMESAQEDAEPKSYVVSSREIRTDGGGEDISYPFVTILRSREELEDYCLAQGKIYDLESGFLEACSAYREDYFADNDLILLCVEETSGSVTHQVTDVREENGEWIITVVRYEPEEGTCDMAQWHILIEVQMGKVIAPESTVTVRFENKEN